MKADLINLLIINLGSTSTKVAVYEDETLVAQKEIKHPTELMQSFNLPGEQFSMRKKAVEDFLAESGYDPKKLTAIVSRGGNVCPLKPGAYRVNEKMIYLLQDEVQPHISNTSPRVAYALAQELGIPTYIYDAVSSDEMSDVARLSGIPFLPRVSLGHPLNQRAVAIRYAQSIGRRYQDLNLIVMHMGGGCSVGMHEKGKIVDIICDDEGGFTPERCGGVFCGFLLEDYHRGHHTFDELRRMWRGKGGLVAYLGTSNVIEVEQRIDAGDEYARLVFDAMVYQGAKTIGSLAAAYDGRINAIILTGGVANSKRWASAMEKKVRFIAPVIVIPGGYEMEALAFGVQRALRGEEPIHEL